ncbi:putative toxin-antitoxin system toxin component, PIN family [Dyadobacter sp. CY356]|uniref:putative toxin-antitoxin system toxin component, PIN family n=1 Tax=Dyadobacter sp. CY356 TaxID=2906442 RepID=UPI001F443170|nr:putative toxin-antitoxin system toxin component, PIN family [Dyadobacter sp. CY356]MCF0056274.1 putative toxin-antitoxin system toxin component, PIN family [Dyadobacter sp. CY356]
MQNNYMRIILDTNLWISFLITKDLSKLDEIIFSKQGTLIFSAELLEEFLEVAQRPKFKKFFPQEDVEQILKTIEEYAEFVTVITKTDVCRDPKDNFLLSLSIDGNADFLITGDKDLLALHPFEKTSIITISDFLQFHPYPKNT